MSSHLRTVYRWGDNALNTVSTLSKRYTIWRPGRHPFNSSKQKNPIVKVCGQWPVGESWVQTLGVQWANNISARWLPETASQAWDPLPLRSRPFFIGLRTFCEGHGFFPLYKYAWSWLESRGSFGAQKMGRLSAEWPLMWGKMMIDQWIQRSFRIHLPSFEVSDLPSMTKPERNLAEGQGNIPAHHHFGHVHYSVVI